MVTDGFWQAGGITVTSAGMVEAGTKVKLEVVDTLRSKTNKVVLTRALVKPNVPGGAANPTTKH